LITPRNNDILDKHVTDELEAMLLQKERSIENATLSRQSETLPVNIARNTDYPNQLGLHHSLETSSSHYLQDFGTFSGALPSELGISPFQNESDVQELGKQPLSPHHNAFISTHSLGEMDPKNSEALAFGLDIFWPNWPPHLPGPELLRHLYVFMFLDYLGILIS
jgi:hypothetical protein